jgi:hypothetical protein
MNRGQRAQREVNRAQEPRKKVAPKPAQTVEEFVAQGGVIEVIPSVWEQYERRAG